MSGVLLVISVLAMCFNMLLTGFFIGYAKKLALATVKEQLHKNAFT